MQTRWFTVLAFFVSIALLALLVLGGVRSSADQQVIGASKATFFQPNQPYDPIIPFADPNDPTKLASWWQWYPGSSEASAYNLDDGPNTLTLMVGPGTDQWLSDNSAPYVSYTISGDFEAEVKLSVAALTNWVVGGLGLMSSQDPENWIRIVYALDNKVYFNKSGYHIITAPYYSHDIYLKLKRQGSQISAYYSASGDNWTTLKENYPHDLPEEVKIYLLGFTQQSVGDVVRFQNFKTAVQSTPWLENLDCDSVLQEFRGIEYCTSLGGNAHIMVIDLNEPDIQLEYMIAKGLHECRDGSQPDECIPSNLNDEPSECRDVNIPAWSSGHEILKVKGCYDPTNIDYYPVMSLLDAVNRNSNTAVVINTDYGAGTQDYPNHLGHGPEGFTVVRGDRIDGKVVGDTDNNAENRPWLAVGEGSPLRAEFGQFAEGEDDGSKPDWVYTGVGGAPWLIRDGEIDSDEISTCKNAKPHSCNSTVAQTAIALSEDGRWLYLVVVVGQNAQGTAEFLREKLQPWQAIKMDGGGSSQLWYGGLPGNNLEDRVVYPGDDRLLSQYLAVIAEPGSGITIEPSLYSISGQVKDEDNNSIEAVTVSAGSTSTVTDGNGNYAFSGLAAGGYTVIPSKYGFSFTPESVLVSLPPDATEQNFIGKIICPVIAALYQTGSNAISRIQDAEDLISLYSQFRDEVLSNTGLGQRYIQDYNQHGPETSAILLADSDLQSRTAQFLEHAAPAFGSLLPNSTEEVVLTQDLYDEAAGLVNDLANAGSQELSDKMLQTWEDLALDKHIGETATEIWQQMQDHTVYLPIILK